MQHKSVTAICSLYEISDNEEVLLESMPAYNPLRIITGLGMTPIVVLEKALANLTSGEEFSLSLDPEEAFGDRNEEQVVDIEKSNFCIDGVFDNDRIYPDAILPLKNQLGEVYVARVVSISEVSVRMDFNHPLAGKSLKIKGTVIDSHIATEEEMEKAGRRNCCCKGGCHSNESADYCNHESCCRGCHTNKDE